MARCSARGRGAGHFHSSSGGENGDPLKLKQVLPYLKDREQMFSDFKSGFCPAIMKTWHELAACHTS